MTDLREYPRLGIHTTTVAQLRPGDVITGGELQGHVTAVEPGTLVGVWIDGCDMRWLLPAEREITVRRRT